MRKKPIPELKEKLKNYCDGCKPEKPDGRVVSLEPPADIPGARRMPLKCRVCGGQADWLVVS